MHSIKLLILEDDLATNRLLSFLLEDLHITEGVHFETDGQRGLQYLESVVASEDFPDLILVDMNMPVMDGIEFLEQYQNLYWLAHPHTKVIALTNSVSERNKQNIFGFKAVSDLVIKPLTEEKISELLCGLSA